MGQSVRNPAPYDRLYVPGSSVDKRKSASKIEYLEDRRRPKVVPFRNDTLQYDFNFTRATGELSAKLQNALYRESPPSGAVPRPQGVGGRRQTPERRSSARPAKQSRAPRSAQTGARGQAPRGQSQPQASRGKPQQAPRGQSKPPQARRDQAPREQSKPPQAARAQTPRGQSKPPQISRGQSQRQGADPRQAPHGRSDERNPRKTDPKRQTARPDAKRNADRPASKTKHAGKGSKRPQRENVTDFRSVGPDQKTPKPRSTGNKNGHGRKLTPTYDLKGKQRGEWRGAPVIEGGVVGFDMVDNSKTRQPENVAKRKLNVRSLVANLLTIAVVFVLMCAALSYNAQVSDYSQQNASIEKNIQLLEEDVSKLKMEIALQEDLGNIQQRAAALGMSHAEDSQVEYVDLASTDVVNEGASLKSHIHDPAAVSEPEPGFIEAAGAWLASIFLPSTETASSSTAETAAGPVTDASSGAETISGSVGVGTVNG